MFFLVFIAVFLSVSVGASVTCEKRNIMYRNGSSALEIIEADVFVVTDSQDLRRKETSCERVEQTLIYASVIGYTAPDGCPPKLLALPYKKLARVTPIAYVDGMRDEAYELGDHCAYCYTCHSFIVEDDRGVERCGYVIKECPSWSALRRLKPLVCSR